MNRSLSRRQMKKQNVFFRISKMRSWFSWCKFLGFSSGRTQNPPVLWLAESACSCPEQPLSVTHGRQRYSILDFASKVVCHETAGFIGFFLPRRALPSIGCLPPRQRCRLWKPLPRQRVPFGILCQQGALAPIGNPEPKEFAIPLESQMRFERSTHKGKMVCGHSFQNINSTKYSECSAVTGIRKAELMHPAFLIPVFILMIAFALQLLQTAEHPPVHPNCTAAHREYCNPSLPGWTPTPDAPPASTRWSAGRSPSQRSG